MIRGPGHHGSLDPCDTEPRCFLPTCELAGARLLYRPIARLFFAILLGRPGVGALCYEHDDPP